MKIGFDAKRAFNNRRGLGNYSRDTIRILWEQLPDNQYVMFTPTGIDSLFPAAPDYGTIVQPTTFFDKMCPSFWRTRHVCSDIDRLQLDVFHGLSHELPYGIEKLNIRKIVTIHDLIFLQYPELYPLIDRYLYKTKYLHSCQIADTVIAISEQTKRDLIDLAHVNEDKIEVIYQGCNRIFAKKLDETDKKRIREKYHLPETFMLNVGAIEKRKNQEVLLKAMAIEQIDCPLVLIGSPTAYLNELKAFIAQHHLDNRVFILSGVATDELPALYQSSSVFLYPSIFEGFGIPILEALYSGVPVIAATGSCLEESGGANSRYVAPHDAAHWADEICNVINDSDLRNSMTQNNATHLAQFSDENIAKRLLSVYRNF